MKLIGIQLVTFPLAEHATFHPMLGTEDTFTLTDTTLLVDPFAMVSCWGHGLTVIDVVDEQVCAELVRGASTTASPTTTAARDARRIQTLAGRDNAFFVLRVIFVFLLD